MKCFFAALITVAMFTGCQSNSSVDRPADGGPVPNAIEHPIQSYQKVTVDQLNTWGFSVEATDLGEGEYGIYVRAQQPAIEEIDNGQLAVNFSLWSDDDQLVLAMPTVNMNQGPFLVLDGYILRIVINAAHDALGLRPGIGYRVDIDPADYL